VLWIVTLDLFQRGDRIDRLRKDKHPLTYSEVRSQAGVLYDRRSAGREIAGGAIADPAGAADDVSVLGDAELAARATHVVAVGFAVRRVNGRIAQSPAMRLQARQVGLIGMNRQTNLERARRALSDLDEAEKLVGA